MRLSDYIDTNTHYSDEDSISFTCSIVCDCGHIVYPHDCYCSRCGRPVEPSPPISIIKTWGEIKEMIRKELEEKFVLSQSQKENQQ